MLTKQTQQQASTLSTINLNGQSVPKSQVFLLFLVSDRGALSQTPKLGPLSGHGKELELTIVLTFFKIKKMKVHKVSAGPR